MCFDVSKDFNEMKTINKTNIPILKTFKVQIIFNRKPLKIENITIKSPIQNKVYFDGTENKLIWEALPITVSLNKKLQVVAGKIYEGFHGYLNSRHLSLSFYNIIREGDLFVSKINPEPKIIFSKDLYVWANIPGGAHYYLNPYTGEIVSDQLLTYLRLNSYIAETQKYSVKYFCDFIYQLVVLIRKKELKRNEK